MARSLDLGKYYSIPYDNKTLNYSKYFNEGEELISTYEDYTSHNTSRLNIEQVKELLLSLDYIKDHL
jgi:UDP-glucose 4-epimerase